MPQAILCDIEGTIGSIAFVRETLFPYASEHLPRFIWRYRDEPAVVEQLDKLAQSTYIDRKDPDAMIRKLLLWMERDRKDPPLKAIQGMIWVQGYREGAYRAHVYDDAYRKLTEWRERGLALHIFSSGSVQAQKLYFRYSDHGDMRTLFTGWFDTRSGSKKTPVAYENIVSVLGLAPASVLFLSDVPAELDAAEQAGLRTTWVRRPQDTPEELRNAFSSHGVVASFDEIAL